MKENELMEQLFRDLFDGDPWLDVSILGTLQHISAAQASKKLDPIPNSIWEIVNHLIAWRLNVLQRVQGNILVTPDTNYIEPITDNSDAAWENTLERLKDSQIQWLRYLKQVNTDTFSEIYPTNKLTYYQHIHGIIQHDAYHLGQIVLLAKYA